MSDAQSLDRALASGIAWTAASRWLAQIVSWGATLYAVRVLTPSDYGLVSMATVSIGFARMVEDFGLDSVLVQDRSVVGVRQSQIAGLMVLLGVGLCSCFALLAQPIAAFFHEPRVAWIIGLMSLLLITDSLQVVPRALLQRDLAFGKLAAVNFVQVAVTQLVLVIAVALGLGFKSLVYNVLAGAVATTALLVWWRPFAIGWPRQFAQIAKPLTQGWRMLVSRMGFYAFTSADQIIIGRTLGKDLLGSYSFATTFSTLAIQEVGSVVSKVVPGIFSTVQQDRPALRRYFLLLTELVSYLTLPMAIGLAVTADLVVQVALGPQWDAVVTPMRILCIYSAFNNSQMLISQLMVWTGQFRAQMWCTLLTAVVVPLCFFAGVKYGLVGIAWVWAIVYPLTNIPALILGTRTVDESLLGWLGALVPAAVCCALMVIGVMICRELQPQSLSPMIRCVSAIGAGAATYLLSMLVLFRGRIWQRLALFRAAVRSGPATGLAVTGTG